MKDKAIDLLKQLTEAHGAPGHEQNVRAILHRSFGDNAITDKFGGIFGVRRGSAQDVRVMLAGHMDEVGFLVQSFTSEGLIRFVPVGGWWGHVLLAQRVRVMNRAGDEILGVITSKPPHFLKPEERKHVMGLDKMYIDVGASSIEDLKQNFGLRIGDPIVPDSSFTQMHHPDLLMCKAFDNRVGTALSVHAYEALANTTHPNIVYSGATAQEEVGCRGAITAARLVDPDVAIVLEGPPADDLPGVGKDERQGVLGGGVQIRLFDPTAISNRQFGHFVVDTAEECGINHQVTVRRSGGTDAKSIHTHGLGVPTVVLGVPARYIHTHNSIINVEDYLSAIDLIKALVERLDKDTVARFTKYI